MSQRIRSGYRFRGFGGVLTILTLLAAGASCSVWVDPDRVQCATTQDCGALGAEFNGTVCEDSVCRPDSKWSCVGYVKRPEPESRMVSIAVAFVDLLSPLTPLPGGVTARVCQKLDTECKTPVASGLTTDTGGAFNFEVPAGFDGFVAFQSGTHLPGLYFITPPPMTDRNLPAVPLVSLDSLTTLAQQAGSEIAEDRGHVLLAAYDCNDDAAPGIRLSANNSDDRSDRFYMVAGLPQVQSQTTDASGWGGFLNLPFGVTQVTATEAAQNKAVGSASLLVRPGSLTYTALVPSPGLPPFFGVTP